MPNQCMLPDVFLNIVFQPGPYHKTGVPVVTYTGSELLG
jgi:hypothetical protein